MIEMSAMCKAVPSRLEVGWGDGGKGCFRGEGNGCAALLSYRCQLVYVNVDVASTVGGLIS